MKKTKRRIILLFLLAALIVFITSGLISPLGVTEYEVYNPALPAAFDGYKILQISDLQNYTDQYILPFARNAEPDIIVLTGDTFYHRMSAQTVDWTIKLIYQMVKIAPVFCVSGNHDLWNPDFKEYERIMADAGVMNLENTGVMITQDSDAIHIMGISDPDTLNDKNASRLVQEYMRQVQSTDGFDILLFHRANMLDCFKDKGFELILSGHLHGGQIRLPFVDGGLLSPEGNFFPRYAGGIYKIDEKTTAVVSRGIGNTSIIPRFYDPPELVLITLRKKL